MKILLLSDIHGNYPALEAIDNYFAGTSFDHIVNCGDSTVYAPFPNEVLDWLRARHAVSILGNTDKKVLKLLKGKDFKKPSNPEKRVMYEMTAAHLSATNQEYLRSFPVSCEIELPIGSPAPGSASPVLGVYHGSPARAHEFLFDVTPDSRFLELARQSNADIVVTGHSHSPYHKLIGGVRFINPGSAGRMFDGDPSACCAVLELQQSAAAREGQTPATGIAEEKFSPTVVHHRVCYDIALTIREIQRLQLPQIYEQMYRLGRKLN